MNLLLVAYLSSLVCAPAPEIAAILESQHQETLAAQGLSGTQGRGLIQLYTSEGGKTFSIVLVTTDGVGCLLSSGEAWQRFTQGQRL